MTSPARRHFIRHQAAAAKAADSEALRPDLDQYEMHLAQLAEHKRRLKQIQSIERKVEFKRKELDEYNAYVDGVLSEPGREGEPDDVLTTIMIWRIDTGDIRGALQIAHYVIEHKTPLPDQYERGAATIIAEEIAEQALHDLSLLQMDDEQIGNWQTNLAVTAALVHDQDMPDQVRAKLHKAIGYAMQGTDDNEALGNLRRAVELNPKVGVKKDIERLERQIKKQQESE